MPAQGTVKIKLHLTEGRWHWTDTKTVELSTYKPDLDLAGEAEYWRARTEQDAWGNGRDVSVSVMDVSLVA